VNTPRTMTFESALAWGGEMEKRLTRWLLSQGFMILPGYDYSGEGGEKAPRLHGSAESLVIPDLLVAKDGGTRWVEVKRKTETTLNRNSGRVETGLAWRLVKHYRRVKQAPGLPVWILFAHEKEGEVRGGEIDDLMTRACPRLWGGSQMDRGGTMFFLWERLRVVVRLEDLP
jgi:hypothetical protein